MGLKFFVNHVVKKGLKNEQTTAKTLHVRYKFCTFLCSALQNNINLRCCSDSLNAIFCGKMYTSNRCLIIYQSA